MLVLSRHEKESLVLGADKMQIEIELTRIKEEKATMSIQSTIRLTAEPLDGIDKATLLPGFYTLIIVVVETRGDKMRMGVEAPKEVFVHRKEVYEAIQRGKTPRVLPFACDPPSFTLGKNECFVIRVPISATQEQPSDIAAAPQTEAQSQQQ